jgi:hypothetical protein
MCGVSERFAKYRDGPKHSENLETMTTIEPTAKRARKSSVVLTDRKCEKRVDKRIRIYDRKCPGLFVSIITAGISTFFFKYTDRGTGKQRCKWLGVYCSETFTVENARSKAYGLINRIGNGENIAETLRQQKVKAVKQGITSTNSLRIGSNF